MRRREFVTLLGGAAAGWPLAARAEQVGRVRRVGILMPYPRGDSTNEARIRAFRQELGKMGWTEGVNVQFDERWTTDNMDRIRAEATSLMATNPDAILSIGGRVIPILMQLSRSIPIIVPGSADPVASGWVASLARPDGNVTGFAFAEISILDKSLEVLKQIAPAVTSVALIYNPDNPSAAVFRRGVETAAGRLGIEFIAAPIHSLSDVDHAMTNLANRSHTGVFVPPDITLFALRDEVVALLGQHRLPAIYYDPAFVKVGGLASYGIDRIDLYRRAGGYVDRILRGEKVGDLPFQQPTKYLLFINAKAAKALGLELPAVVLALADEVIE